jgi:hypothetical protein
MRAATSLEPLAESVHISTVGLGNGLGAPQRHFLGRYHLLQAAASPQLGTFAGSVLPGWNACSNSEIGHCSRRWMWMATNICRMRHELDCVVSGDPLCILCHWRPDARRALQNPCSLDSWYPTGLASDPWFIHGALTCVSPLAELRAQGRAMLTSIASEWRIHFLWMKHEPAAVCDAYALWQRSRKKSLIED